RVVVGVVLIGDVDVGAGEDVVADLDRLMADDVRAAPDGAPATDGHDALRAQVLSGDHARGDGDALAHQRVLADLDPRLAEDRAGGEGQTGALAQPSEPVGTRAARRDSPGAADRGPSTVDEEADGPPQDIS